MRMKEEVNEIAPHLEAHGSNNSHQPDGELHDAALAEQDDGAVHDEPLAGDHQLPPPAI